MSVRVVGIVVSGDAATIVDAEMPTDLSDPIVILADNSWRLQKGEKGAAYHVLHQRCADYLRENSISRVVIKASALPTGAAKLGLLNSAELRGVIIAAAASVCEIKLLTKASISRTYGERKVDEYIEDDSFWGEQTTGKTLRKLSRESAMLIIANRNT